MNVIPIQNVAFDDTATSVMGEAFDKACKSLRSFGSGCTVREIIAKRIIESAENGERDPARLHEQALRALGIDDMSMLVVSVARDVPIPGSVPVYASITQQRDLKRAWLCPPPGSLSYSANCRPVAI